jgi:hypothetical protein
MQTPAVFAPPRRAPGSPEPPAAACSRYTRHPGRGGRSACDGSAVCAALVPMGAPQSTRPVSVPRAAGHASARAAEIRQTAFAICHRRRHSGGAPLAAFGGWGALTVNLAERRSAAAHLAPPVELPRPAPAPACRSSQQAVPPEVRTRPQGARYGAGVRAACGGHGMVRAVGAAGGRAGGRQPPQRRLVGSPFAEVDNGPKLARYRRDNAGNNGALAGDGCGAGIGGRYLQRHSGRALGTKP